MIFLSPCGVLHKHISFFLFFSIVVLICYREKQHVETQRDTLLQNTLQLVKTKLKTNPNKAQHQTTIKEQ
jgi:hypothetical protein